MDATAIDSALDPIIRLQWSKASLLTMRAIRISAERLAPGRRAGTKLRSLVAASTVAELTMPGSSARRHRSGQYAQCREQLTRIRANEVRRANQVQQRIRARRPHEGLTPLLAVLAIVALAALGGLAHASLVLLAVFVPIRPAQFFLIGFCYRVVRWAWARCVPHSTVRPAEVAAWIKPASLDNPVPDGARSVA